MGLAPVGQGDHPYLGGIKNTLHLDAEEILRALAQCLRSAQTLLLHQSVQMLPDRPVANSNESPGLHVSHAWGMMRCQQQARECARIHLTAGEVAHVTALENGPIDPYRLSSRQGR